MSKTVRIPRRSRAGILAAIILGICLLLLLTVGVLTVGAASTHPPRLVDNAGLLSQAEADSLRATLDQYSEELNFDIVVVTTNTLDGKTPRDCADDYFDYNGYGYGANRDGALFLRYINGSSKEVWLSTSGEGIKAIRDADIESIFDDMEDDIRANRYGVAFQVLAQDVQNEILNARGSAHPPRLVDNAGLLSQAEADSLRATLDQYSEELNFDIVVVTTNTLDGKTPRDCADDYFDYNGYGYGANRDGALFLRYINGSSKEVWLSTSGEGIKAIRDADIESIFDDMEDDIRANRYGAAFRIFAQDVRDEVLDYRSYDTIWIFVGLAVGLGVGLIATNAMRSSLKSVRQQRYAGSYIKGNSVNITEARDIFLYRTVSRVAKPKESSGGGSSTHTSSSGRSHGGGGRSM